MKILSLNRSNAVRIEYYSRQYPWQVFTAIEILIEKREGYLWDFLCPLFGRFLAQSTNYGR